MAIRRTRAAVALGVVVALASVAFLTTGGAGAQNAGANALPRAQTLYMTGHPVGRRTTSFNPLRNGYATGTLGLLYETLFRYDPLKDTFIPWLATSGKWVGKSYVATLRNGRQVERRPGSDGRGREVHVRDRQARRRSAELACGRRA